MDGIYTTAMGDRGRLVVPADLRRRVGLTEGTPVVLVETPRGIVLMRREQLKQLVRDELQGLDLVDELLADRRAEAQAEDVA